MKKRKLTGEEKILVNKMMNNSEQDKSWLEYQLKYYDLMLSSGLEENHKKNIKDFKQKQHEFAQELEIVKKKLSILQDQMRNGVEVKSKKEIKKEAKREENA